jgi:hypothetical protein
MNRNPSESNLNQEKAALERLIARAADGELNRKEMEHLQRDLKLHPDLNRLYHQIVALPDLSNAYPDVTGTGHSSQIDRLLQVIVQSEFPQPLFLDTAIVWFKKYALAASILIMAVTSIFYINRDDTSASADVSINELFYGQDEPEAESYVLYLEELLQ